MNTSLDKARVPYHVLSVGEVLVYFTYMYGLDPLRRYNT